MCQGQAGPCYLNLNSGQSKAERWTGRGGHKIGFKVEKWTRGPEAEIHDRLL